MTSTPMMDLTRFQLRRVRTVAELTQEEFGKKINYSGSQVSAMEVGTRPLDGPYLARVDDVFETGGLLVHLLKIAVARRAASVRRPPHPRGQSRQRLRKQDHQRPW